MNKIENLKSTILVMSKNYIRTSDNYNPLKYARGSKLIDESFINSNLPEINFSKNLKEWKENEKKGNKNIKQFDDYLSKAKYQLENSETNKIFNDWKINNTNNSNSNSFRNSIDNITGPNFHYSSDSLPNQIGCHNINNTPNNFLVGNSNANLCRSSINYNKNFNASNNGSTNYYSKYEYKENMSSFLSSESQAAPITNQSENMSLHNTREVSSSNDGFFVNRNPVCSQHPNKQIENQNNNTFNKTVPISYSSNFNLSEFYNINNLKFPKQ